MISQLWARVHTGGSTFHSYFFLHDYRRFHHHILRLCLKLQSKLQVSQSKAQICSEISVTGFQLVCFLTIRCREPLNVLGKRGEAKIDADVFYSHILLCLEILGLWLFQAYSEPDLGFQCVPRFVGRTEGERGRRLLTRLISCYFFY